MKTTNYLQISRLAKFNKFTKKLLRKLQNGNFFHLSKFKQQKLLKRFKRQINRLNISLPQALKHKLAAAGLVLALLGSVEVQGQNFKPPVRNAFGTNGHTPYLVDIDGDGDFDLFTGGYSGATFYENIGTDSLPNFSNPVTNPFNLNLGHTFLLKFTDIDADGDEDLFASGTFGKLHFYQNIGTATNPNFDTLQVNPFGLDSTKLGRRYAPILADIDGDGDFDMFAGTHSGSLAYFENIGNDTLPNFNSNALIDPFGLPTNADILSISFVDIDKDSDLDAFITHDIAATLMYCENIGNDTLPNFAAPQWNVFGFNESYCNCYLPTSFADIDADGDEDLFHGTFMGWLEYYENGSYNNTIPSMDTMNLGPDFLCGNTGQLRIRQLTQIHAGANERQLVNVYARSMDTTKIPHPTVWWGIPLGLEWCTNKLPGNIAELNYTPYAGSTGEATITIYVDDLAQNNNIFTHDFTVYLDSCVFVNTPPTLDAIPNQSFCELIPLDTIQLTGIGPGGLDPQAVTIVARSSDSTLVPHPTVIYSGGTTAKLIAQQSRILGTKVDITVTVNDGYQSNNTTSRTFELLSKTCSPPSMLPLGQTIICKNRPVQRKVINGVQLGGSRISNLNFTISSNNLIDTAWVVYFMNVNHASLYYQTKQDSVGLANINVNVDDGYYSSNQIFQLEVKSCTSIEVIEKETKISIQPNPAQDKVSIFIESENILGKFNLEIRNALGQIVHQETINSKQNNFNKNLNVQAFEAGIYFIQIKGIGFEQNEKLIIQK